jgi:ABC-type uncharacterized transport system ATPase subunit
VARTDDAPAEAGREPDGAPLAVECRGITRRYAGVIANDHVDFKVREGEIHALVGENGAGKSTLMKMVYGMEQPDEGEILVRGKPEKIDSPRKAIALRIGMVHQHFMLVDAFTVAENVVLGAEPANGGRLDLDEANREVAELARGFGTNLDPAARVETLAVGQQERRPFSRRGLLNPKAMRQRATDLVRAFRVKAPSIAAPAYALSGGNQQKLVLAREFASGPKLLIAAYPTRGLDIGATEFVWKQLVSARDAGLAVLLISANLEEILALADRVGVIYDGRITAELDGSQATMNELGLYMTGARSDREPAA